MRFYNKDELKNPLCNRFSKMANCPKTNFSAPHGATHFYGSLKFFRISYVPACLIIFTSFGSSIRKVHKVQLLSYIFWTFPERKGFEDYQKRVISGQCISRKKSARKASLSESCLLPTVRRHNLSFNGWQVKILNFLRLGSLFKSLAVVSNNVPLAAFQLTMKNVSA